MSSTTQSVWGERFCTEFGLQTLDSIPEFVPEFAHCSRYVGDEIDPKAMGQHSLVRGIDPLGSPFIAMKCELLDADLKRIAETVAVIFKDRPPLENWPYQIEDFTTQNILQYRGMDRKNPFFQFGIWKNQFHINILLFQKVMRGERIEIGEGNWTIDNSRYLQISKKS